MRNLKQEHIIKGPLDEVYMALTNPFTIELWSGYPAEFVAEEGTEFSMWEGDITGKNLKFIENELVEQQWYFEGNEADSIVCIRLSNKGANTHVELTHINIPEEAFEDMKEGWREYYFGALKKYFK